MLRGIVFREAQRDLGQDRNKKILHEGWISDTSRVAADEGLVRGQAAAPQSWARVEVAPPCSHVQKAGVRMWCHIRGLQ